jgi:hypothetical protein
MGNSARWPAPSICSESGGRCSSFVSCCREAATSGRCSAGSRASRLGGRAGRPRVPIDPGGRELAAVVRELGTWGQRWLPRELRPSELDAEALGWDIHRRVRRDALPEKPVVVEIELTDVRGAARRHYLLLRRSEVSLCTYNPGFPEELCLRADRRTLIGWWRGDLTLRQAREAGLILDGQRERVRAFPNWLNAICSPRSLPFPGLASGHV